MSISVRLSVRGRHTTSPLGPSGGPHGKARRLNANDTITPDAQQKQDRARKRKALLAGGVVLGLGAAVTLAAWSDDVFANGIFNTGT
ncbi:MAG: SipW-dependent-type signal peptide-containing protein, partial [Dietzia sp.]